MTIKKITALTAAAVLSLALASCGGKSEEKNKADSSISSEEQTTAEPVVPTLDIEEADPADSADASEGYSCPPLYLTSQQKDLLASLQEIYDEKTIKFGTQSPIPFNDNEMNESLSVKIFGEITYLEAVDGEVDENQLKAEVISYLMGQVSAASGNMSYDVLKGHAGVFGDNCAVTLFSDDWYVTSVKIADIALDEESQEKYNDFYG